MSTVNLDFYKNNYISRDFELQVPVKDMIDSVLNAVEENLSLVNCNYKWVSDSDISIIKEYGCIGDYDNDYLESVVSSAYNDFIEDLSTDDDEIDMTFLETEFKSILYVR